jgi:hypothetical protein
MNELSILLRISKLEKKKEILGKQPNEVSNFKSIFGKAHLATFSPKVFEYLGLEQKIESLHQVLGSQERKKVLEERYKKLEARIKRRKEKPLEGFKL